MALNGKMNITIDAIEGKSRLRHCFFTPPFKVMSIGENSNARALELMIMNSSPGVLDNDNYSINITLCEAAALHLSTQAYQRLFQMQTGAVQQTTIIMREGSSLVYLPHPSVPHAGSHFFSKTHISIEKKCRLIIGEVLSNGRNLNGESFLFTRYQSRLEIFFHDRLRVCDNQVIEPAKAVHLKMGMLEGYSHQAGMFIINSHIKEENMMEQIRQMTMPGVCIGVSRLPQSGIVVRMLGTKAEQLHTLLKTMAQLFISNEADQNGAYAV